MGQTMRELVGGVFIAAFAVGMGCGDSSKGGPVNAFCTEFTGQINGIAATATCTAEVLPSHTVMTCQVSSGAFGYIFAADMIGNRGWADMVESPSGNRMRVQVDLLVDGFLLTVNPFGAPTQYTFTCS